MSTPKSKITPKPLRLNKNHRAKLGAHAKEVLDCPAERRAEERAHAKALTAIHRIVAELSPLDDMAVLRQYGHTALHRHMDGGDGGTVRVGKHIFWIVVTHSLRSPHEAC